MLLLEEVRNIDAIELRLEMIEQKRTVENHHVVVQRIGRIRAAIETFDEWQGRFENLRVRDGFIKCPVLTERLAE